MRRLFIILIALLLISGMAMAEQLTPSEYLEGIGFAVYQVGGVSEIGLDESLFSGDNAGVSFCGCYYDANQKIHSFFWREADGSVYVARSSAQALIGSLTPVLGGLGTIKQFTDMCEQCGFSLGLYLDGGYFTFGMPEDDDNLISLATAIAAGRPMTYRVGWEAFLQAITLPGLY